MEQIKCASCNLVNLPGATVCSNCGADLGLPIHPAPVDLVTPVPVVVERPAPVVVVRGMSDSAKLLTALATIVGVALIGFFFYQWGLTNNKDQEEAAARNENSRRANDRLPPATAAPAPAPTTVVLPSTVTTAPPPTVIVPEATPPPVDRELVRYSATIDPMLERWKTELRKAETAQGADLTASIARLQDIQRQVSRVTPAPMATGVHTRLLEAMTAIMDSLNTASQTQTAVNTLPDYTQAQELFNQFETEYGTIRAPRV